VNSRQRTPGLPTIPPPPSLPLRQQRLSDHWAEHLNRTVTHPIFVTVQPNTASGCPLSVSSSPGANNPEDRLWAFVGALLHQLDKSLTGCLKPGFLGPAHRLQGYAILEKLHVNPHVHMLISSPNRYQRFWTALGLFELLDTVSWGREDEDDVWQQDCWQTLIERRWLTHAHRTRTFSPLLHRLAPGGTATVQVPFQDKCPHGVFGYSVKELGRASLKRAYDTQYWGKRADLQIRELREFHSKLGYEAPASFVRRDPITGTKTLNLDDPNPWKRKGERVR
jgi:hypothetical protein